MWYCCVAGLGEEMADGDDGQVEREYSIIAVDVTEIMFFSISCRRSPVALEKDEKNY